MIEVTVTAEARQEVADNFAGRREVLRRLERFAEYLEPGDSDEGWETEASAYERIPA